MDVTRREGCNEGWKGRMGWDKKEWVGWDGMGKVGWEVRDGMGFDNYEFMKYFNQYRSYIQIHN